MADIQNFLNSINWSTPSWDLFIVLFFLVAAVLYGLSLGRNRILVILISIYMALALVNVFPFSQELLSRLKLEDSFMVKLVSFTGLLLILFFLLSRSALSSALVSKSGEGSWFQILIFSFLHVGLLISVILSFVPNDFVSNLAPLTKKVFTTDTARFLWLLLPIIAMCFVRRQRRKIR